MSIIIDNIKNLEDKQQTLTDFVNFIKTGKYKYTYLGHPSFYVLKELLIIVDGSDIYVYHLIDDYPIEDILNSTPSAKIIKYQNNNILICNGDETYDESIDSDLYYRLNEHAFFEKYVTVSFKCLNLLSKNLNKLILIDYSPDQRRRLTKKERMIKDKTKLKRIGFTLINNNWHKASTSVFYDKGNRQYYILGQDEGSYFGCQLPRKVTSLKDAYNALIPKKATNYIDRQGEWFVVPVSDIPDKNKCLALVSSIYDETIFLPTESDKSSRHYIYSKDIRISKKIYALDPILIHSHGNHDDVKAEGWCTFIKNTAKRSFSVTGVD